ncbi:MAG: gephyrin-like molybdotransferase Glp [Pseudomonadota bacterium]
MNDSRIQTAPSCRDDHDPASLPVQLALARIESALNPIRGFEKVATRSALGRVLAQDVSSTLDVPGHTNSAMDGYAINGEQIPSKGTRELKVIGTSWAGRPYRDEIAADTCVRIMTGAVMAPGTDTVIMQEHVELQGEHIRFDASHKPGQNVRQAGEDIAKGKVVLTKGKRISPADIGLLASLGTGEVLVHRRLRVAFFSTGDELRAIGEPLEEGMIYDSNRYTLYGMLTRLGADVIDMGVIKDVREDTFEAFAEAANCADVIITSGGVSVGEADYVKETLDKVGKVNFWKVAMKPGRPLAFGRVKDAYFFGLPGNPVSVMITFYIFVQPALRKLSGESKTENLTLNAPCISTLRKRPGRVEFQRGILERNDKGQYQVRKTGPQGSGILHSMTEANCLIILPLESTGVEPGTEVEVVPFQGLV